MSTPIAVVMLWLVGARLEALHVEHYRRRARHDAARVALVEHLGKVLADAQPQGERLE